MDELLNRIQQLEQRTRRMERRLHHWRLAALLIGVAAIVGYFTAPAGQAQPGAATGNAVTAPFVVRGANGVKLFEVAEFVDRGTDNSQDTLMTLYRNGRQAAMYRTTGKAYKDAYDPAENYLNVVETWLYRYPRDSQGKIEPTAYLAASTALTRAGGSIVVFGDHGQRTTTPPMAARLTAKRGVGGAVMLFDNDGQEGKVLQSR
jgi:hypothetical protein